MRARGFLIAALVLVLGGTAAVAFVAASDDGQQSTAFGGGSSSSDPPPPAPAETETLPTQPGGDGAPTIEESPPETGTDTGAAPAAPEPKLGDDAKGSSGGAQKTHFKREKGKQPQDDKPDRKFAVPPAQQFSGEGNASLGTVDVKANSLLKWRARGRLEIRFGREAFPIVAPTRSGQLVLPPFIFTKVRVIAGGPWRITINPQ